MEPRQQEKGSWESFKPVRTQRPTAKAGWGTRVLAAIFMGVVGAVVATFFLFYIMGYGRTGRRYQREQPVATVESNASADAFFIGLVACGFIVGALIPIFAWPKLNDDGPLE